MNDDEKKCPRCAEIIKREAKMCRFCQYEFTPDELAADAARAPDPEWDSDLAPTPAKPPKKPNRAMGWLLFVVGFFVLIIVIGIFNQPSPAEKAATEKAEAEKTAAEGAKEAENRRTGMVCLSAWDGSHRGLVESVKASLREPKSFEHVETRIAPVDEKGHNKIVMQYRARNGFGGMNVGAVVGSVNNADCSLISFKSVE